VPGGLKTWIQRAAVLVAVFAVLGFLVAASGIVSIAASSGHLAVTRWFLEFAKSRSVATHTMTLDLAPPREPWLALKGAGHYESGCRPCHGSPGRRNLPIAASMTPRPPYLPAEIGELSPEELFYVVKHGIKLTGMPAWPSQQRDDEVRAMVAFLLELPSMDAESYRRLVHGEVPAGAAASPPLEELGGAGVPPSVTSSCARCHGMDGSGRGNAAFPALAGQHREYLLRALDAYARGARHSGIMRPVAAGLSPEERRELADYYGSLPHRAPGRAGNASAAAIARGRRIAMEGLPEQGVPSCVDCHGPGSHRHNQAYPNLEGQYADYLVLQLQLFHEGRRGGSPYAHIMRHVAARLKPEQMRDVAAYYASVGTHGEGGH
jgi:cytochrome c553